MNKNNNTNGINYSQKTYSDNNSREPSAVFGQTDSQRPSSKKSKMSMASSNQRRSNSFQFNRVEKDEYEEEIKDKYQDSFINDRRSDSVNHQQSLNNFLNSKQNSEIVQESQNQKKYQSTQNQQSHFGTKSTNQISNHFRDANGYSQISRNQSQFVQHPGNNSNYYNNSKIKLKPQNQKAIQDLATLQEDKELHASFLSDENGRIIQEINDTNKFFYKSGLKGVIYLVSECSNSAIGMLPYLFSQFGIVLSIVLILTLITISNFSFYYLLKAKNLSRRSNYHSIAQYLSGISGYRFIFIIQFFTKFANCTMLMYFASKQLQQFILNVKGKQNLSESQLNFVESYQFYLILMLIILFVLSLLIIDSHQTTFTQLVNIIFLFSMIILSLISFISTIQTEEMQGDYLFAPDDFKFGYAFSSLSILLFLLDIHINFFNLYKYLRKPSDRKMLRTSLYANMVLGLCFIFIGSFGYISTTGLDRNANYLIQFSQLDLHITFSSFALMIYVLYCVVNFPLQFSIVRSHILKLFKTIKVEEKQSTLDFPNDLDREATDQPQFFKSSSQDVNYGNQSNPYIVPVPIYGYYNETLKDSNLQQSHIYMRQIRFYASSVVLQLVMFVINFFLTGPLLIILFSGVFFSSVNAFIIPTVFYIKLSNYESTLVVIISVLLLFTILGLDFTTLLGQVFTLIE
ncbi:hypothetical protein ABPG72_003359 [Tetrahymena utriculariae]